MYTYLVPEVDCFQAKCDIYPCSYVRNLCAYIMHHLLEIISVGRFKTDCNVKRIFQILNAGLPRQCIFTDLENLVISIFQRYFGEVETQR